MAKSKSSARTTANFILDVRPDHWGELLDELKAASDNASAGCEGYESMLVSLDVACRASDELEAALKAGDIEGALLASHEIGFAKGADESHGELWKAATKHRKAIAKAVAAKKSKADKVYERVRAWLAKRQRDFPDETKRARHRAARDQLRDDGYEREAGDDHDPLSKSTLYRAIGKKK